MKSRQRGQHEHNEVADHTVPDARYHGLSLHKFNTLGTYNAEKARGIMHTPEWEMKMAVLQTRYNDGVRAYPQ